MGKSSSWSCSNLVIVLHDGWLLPQSRRKAQLNNTEMDPLAPERGSASRPVEFHRLNPMVVEAVTFPRSHLREARYCDGGCQREKPPHQAWSWNTAHRFRHGRVTIIRSSTPKPRRTGASCYANMSSCGKSSPIWRLLPAPSTLTQDDARVTATLNSLALTPENASGRPKSFTHLPIGGDCALLQMCVFSATAKL